MTKPPSLNAAYGLETPEDNQALYRDWAGTYDQGFVGEQDYRLHIEVAEAYVAAGGTGPVLDVGAGTGVVGEVLSAKGISGINGTDISPDMLAEAAMKDVYDRLFEGNILEEIDAEEATYKGAVSAGTFTLGHVGPEGLREVVRVVAPGGWIVISVRDLHFHEKGFEAALSSLPLKVETRTVPIYGPACAADHKDDKAVLVVAQRR